MITAKHSTQPKGQTITRFLVIFASTMVFLTGVILSASPNEDRSDRGLAGTWVSLEGGAQLVTFTADGRLIGSVPVNIVTHNGPGGGNELAAPSQGEWIRTGNRDFVTTAFSILSSPDAPAGLTHVVKLTGNWQLNKANDELTLISPMITVLLPDGTQQFPPFPGSVTHFKRVVAGQ